MEDGTSAEMGLTGNDGLVGIALFMGGGAMPNRAVVQSAGGAIRMKAKVLQDEFARGGKFQHLLLRYTQALITQISQTAVCNRLHSVEQQLVRLVFVEGIEKLWFNQVIKTTDGPGRWLGRCLSRADS
ncbi:MAG: Crp/Fnr family transcriptional regulator [Pyrinomonadaceae bacterium]